jgi:hypothetical protein
MNEIYDNIFLLWLSKELNQITKEQQSSWCHPILLIHELLFVGCGF